MVSFDPEDFGLQTRKEKPEKERELTEKPDLREVLKENSKRLKEIGFLERPEPKMFEDIQFLSPEEREELRKNYISSINSLEETIKNGETDLKKAITENNLQPLGALDVLLKTRKLDPGEFQLGKNILARAGIKNVSDAQELALEFLRDHYAELLNKDK